MRSFYLDFYHIFHALNNEFYRRKPAGIFACENVRQTSLYFLSPPATTAPVSAAIILARRSVVPPCSFADLKSRSPSTARRHFRSYRTVPVRSAFFARSRATFRRNFRQISRPRSVRKRVDFFQRILFSHDSTVCSQRATSSR